MARARLATTVAVAIALPFAAALVPAFPAAAAPVTPQDSAPSDIRTGTRTPNTIDGGPLAVPHRYTPKVGARANGLAPAGVTPPVGTVRQWVGSDDFNGYLPQGLHAARVGQHIEVWVANDLAFPAGDCRTDRRRRRRSPTPRWRTSSTSSTTTCTRRRRAAFSTPPDRDGTNALLRPGRQRQRRRLHRRRRQDRHARRQRPGRQLLRLPGCADVHRGLLLLAVQRAARPQRHDDRRVRLAAPHDGELRRTSRPPTCAPAARRARASTRARSRHEWQHLLHYYTDPFETTWLNEGLSDFAQTLTGYVDSDRHGLRPGRRQPHLLLPGLRHRSDAVQPQPPRLRRAGELAEPLGRGRQPATRCWPTTATRTRSCCSCTTATAPTSCPSCTRTASCRGLPASDAALEAEGVHDMYRVIHDYQTMTWWTRSSATRQARDRARRTEEPGDDEEPALDGQPGQPGRQRRSRARRPTAPTTCRCRRPTARPCAGVTCGRCRSPAPRRCRRCRWPGPSSSNDPDRPGNPVLWSGNGNNTDAAAVTSVDRADRPTRRCASSPSTARSRAYDYGYVTVSTDGGATYTTIPGDRTVDGPLGPGAQRDDDRLRAALVRPVGVRRADRPGRVSGTSVTAASTRAVCSSTTSPSAAPRSATAPASLRSTRRPRSSRSRWTTGTSG